MHIVTCSNYFDLNKTVALRTVRHQKRLFLANFLTNFRVICPFRLYKIFQFIYPDKSRKLSPMLELIMKIQHKCF